MSYAEDYVNRLRQIQAARVVGSMPQPTVSKSDLANLILQKARSNFGVSGPPSMPEKKKGLGEKAKSVGLGIIDILSRPGYAVSEAANVGFNEGGDLGDILRGAKEGITGEKQTSYIDVLQTQHKNEIVDSDEYKRILKEYGPKEAEWYKQNQEKTIDSGLLPDIAGGLLVDFTLDPLNAVGIGPVKNILKSAGEITSAGKALEGIEATQEVADVAKVAPAPRSDVSEAVQQAPITPAEATPTVSQDLIDKLRSAQTQDQTSQVFPTVQGKFGSNRRPPVKNIEGQKVEADYSGTVVDTLRKQPQFASIANVFNRDIRSTDFEKLQDARVINETAQVVDQVAKGNPAAVDLLTNKNINPLSPVARQSVDEAVNHVVREITESIADPAKARAAGKQPRHPVFNAPTQNNLSNKLANSARNQLKAEGFVRGGAKISKPASGRFVPAVFSRYMDMLKNAEESMVTRARDELNDAYYPRGGIKPGSPYLRLSDVLEALPKDLATKVILGPNPKDKVHPSIILKAITGNNAALGKIAARNSELLKAIQDIDWTPLMVKEYATRTIDSANAAHRTVDDVAKFITAKMGDNTSDVEKAGVIDATVKAGKREFSKEMPAAKTSVNEMLDGLRKSIPNPTPNIVDDIIERGKQKLAAGVFSDKNGQHVAQGPRVETAAATIEDITGMPAKEAGLTPVAADQAADGIFATVLSWVKPNAGYKELRPLLLKNISARRTSATTRAHEVIRTFSSVPEAEHMDFWNEVRGMVPVIEHHAEAVQNMQKLLGNMFGESGLTDMFAGKTSIARAGINIDHLNKHLKIVGIDDFKFIRDVEDPLNPKKMLRLEGQQILDTWKRYTPKNSKDLRVFVFNMTQAVENSMVEYSTFANLAALYGRKKPGNGLVQVTDMHSAINGMYFPTDLAPQMGKLVRGIDEMFEPLSSGSQFWKMYDQGLRTWKTGVTIYAPSHHIRNMIGDMFLSWMDGLNNPIYYTKAAQVLKANMHRYSDIQTGKNPLKDILGEGRETEIIAQIIGQAKNRTPKGTRVVAKAVIGKKRYPVTIDQAYQMAFRHGLLPHSAVIEDLPGAETLAESLANRFHPGKAGPFAPAKGKVATKVRGVSETREHYVRMAHWLYALDNTKANSLEELFQKAADRVRKYHPDGLDLTQTEKKVFRRLFPFYSWTRKAIPLVLEGLVMHPNKILAYPRIMSAEQELQGIESSTSDPWPDDQLFPDWLASNIIGPTIPAGSAFSKAIARSPEEVGYGVVNPGNPATDIMEDFFNDPVKGIGNSITPAIKLPAEMAFGREFQSGAPIDDKTEYLDKNIPLLSTLSRITHGAAGTGIVEGGDLRGKETEPFNPTALINYLTAAGIIDTGRYQKGGEFDLRERLRKEKENAER